MYEGKDFNCLRISNTRLVYDYIRKHQKAIRKELADETGLSLPSITRVTSTLLEIGFIKEAPSFSDKVGRKSSILEISENIAYSYGIHIDRNFFKVGIVNFGNKIIGTKKVLLFTRNYSAKDVILLACENLEQLRESLNISKNKIIGAGIAIPGVINSNDGIQIFSPQLGWEGLSIRNLAEEILNIPVVVDNDVKSHAFGETYLRQDEKTKSTVFLHVGSGVGAAYIQNGQVFKGSVNSAGEIGHVKIDTGGTICDCGRTGCLQTHMTEWAIVNKAKEFKSEITNSNEVIDYMNRGYSWASQIIFDLVNYTSITIGILDAVYDPDLIIVGGELIEDNQMIFNMIINRYEDTKYDPISRTSKILRSSLLGNGILLGAAMISIDKFLKEFEFNYLIGSDTN